MLSLDHAPASSDENLLGLGVSSKPSDHLPSVLDALVRMLALVDVSLRECLLTTVTLVGGGSFAPEFPERLEQGLREALKPAPWAPRVVAGKQQRG